MDDQQRPRWQFYVLRCKDGTYYAGITVDMARRFAAHRKGTGAKYMKPKKRHPFRLVYAKPFWDRAAAQVCEAAFKKLSRDEKTTIVRTGVWERYDA